MYLKLLNCNFKYLLLIIVLIFDSAKSHNINNTQHVKEEVECLTEGCKDAARIISSNMNEKKDPCKDFYGFACGNFIEKTTIPADKDKYNSISEVNEKVQRDMKRSLEQPYNSSDLRIFHLIKKYYKACMNSSAIEESSLKTLNNIINEVGGWPIIIGKKWDGSQFDWTKLDIKLNNIGYPPKSIFNIFVRTDAHNTSQNLLYIDPFLPYTNTVSLGLGLKDTVVAAYEAFMTNVAVYFGAKEKHIKREIREIVSFEIKLAEAITVTKPSDVKIEKIKDLEKAAPSIPWKHYINSFTEPTIHIKHSDIIHVKKPHYISKVDKLLKQTDNKTIANYMIWRIIADSIPYMNKDLLNIKTIYDEATEVYKNKERWEECLNLLVSESGLIVGASALFVKEHFDKEARTAVTPILYSIIEEVKETLTKDVWLTEVSKSVAIRKSDYMLKVIAYPDQLVDNETVNNYSRTLKLDKFNHFQNFLNLNRFHFNYSISGLLESTDHRLWVELSDSTIVNAYYYSIYNAFGKYNKIKLMTDKSYYKFNQAVLAAILQYPVFNPSWPINVQFGSIGFIIGHEIMHAYDLKNIVYDENGNFNKWLTKEDEKNINKKVNCFIKQYSKYTDENLGVSVNGQQTYNENLADNNGMKVTYNAYKKWLKKRDKKIKLPGLKYNPEEIFWISWGSSLCSKTTEGRILDEIAYDGHTPDSFRVKGIASNSIDFSETFKCPEGSPMNPKKKCELF